MKATLKPVMKRTIKILLILSVIILILDQIFAFAFRKSIETRLVDAQVRLEEGQHIEYMIWRPGGWLHPEKELRGVINRGERVRIQPEFQHGLIWQFLSTDWLEALTCPEHKLWCGPTVYAVFDYWTKDTSQPKTIIDIDFFKYKYYCNPNIDKQMNGEFLWSPRRLMFAPYGEEWQ